MSDYKALSAALRCSCTVGASCTERCPYRTMEKIDPMFPLPADVTIDGVGYWISCDYERMTMDAADAIEKLIKERDAAMADLNRFRPCYACKHCPDRRGEYSWCSMDSRWHAGNDPGCYYWEWRGVQEADDE